MNRDDEQLIRFLITVAAFVVLSLLAVLIWSVSGFVQSYHVPEGPLPETRRPISGPTTAPTEHRRIILSEHIIQQNPTCWSGVPGRTCDKEAWRD